MRGADKPAELGNGLHASAPCCSPQPTLLLLPATNASDLPSPSAAPPRRYDPSATDCWSMGVLLYLIVVGYYPFEVSCAGPALGRRRQRVQQLPGFCPLHCAAGCAAPSCLPEGVVRAAPRSWVLHRACSPAQRCANPSRPCLPACLPLLQDPVQQHNVLLTLQNIRAGRYRQIPASVSPACRDLITRLLLLDPAARITLPEVLAHPFLAAAVAQEAAPPAQAPAQAVVEAAGEVEAAAGEAATIPAFCHAEQRPGFAFPLCHGPELHKPTPQFIDLAAAAAAAAAAEAAAAKAASAGTRPEEAAKPRAGSGFLNFCSFWGIGSCRTHE